MVTVWNCEGFERLTCLTKYCVIVPLGMTVASSPSPQPISVAPVGHDDVLNDGERQVVPRSSPEALYDQVAPFASSVAVASGGGLTASTAVVAERFPSASTARTK
jgi:hypothetical protein